MFQFKNLTFRGNIRPITGTLTGLVRRSRLPAFIGLMLLAFTLDVGAVDDDLPRAEDLLDRMVEATGGREAYDKIENRVTEGKMEIVGQGIELSLTVCAAKPNLAHTTIESAATGKIEGGTNGTVVWENSLLTGPRVRTGMERANGLRDAVFDRMTYWQDSFERVECTAKEDVDGTPCFKLVLHPKPVALSDEETSSSEPMIVYVDAQSGLMAKVESKVETPAGTIPITIIPSDYQEVDGILIPHKIVTKVLTQERVMTWDSVRHNVKLPEDRFALPKEIQELVDDN